MLHEINTRLEHVQDQIHITIVDTFALALTSIALQGTLCSDTLNQDNISINDFRK